MAETILFVSGGIVMISIIVAGMRLLLGPGSADRTVAFDTLTIISISLIAMIALHAGRVIYLDVALIYGILSFIGVVAVARYLERGL